MSDDKGVGIQFQKIFIPEIDFKICRVSRSLSLGNSSLQGLLDDSTCPRTLQLQRSAYQCVAGFWGKYLGEDHTRIQRGWRSPQGRRWHSESCQTERITQEVTWRPSPAWSVPSFCEHGKGSVLSWDSGCCVPSRWLQGGHSQALPSALWPFFSGWKSY